MSRLLKAVLVLLPLLVFAVVVAYFMWALTEPDRDPSDIPVVMVDKPVPEFDLPPVPGVDRPGFSTGDLVLPPGDPGKVRLINVFASWCVPCRAEHPILMRLAERDGVEIYGIDYQDKPSDVRNWLAELGNPFIAIGDDRDGQVGVVWGIRGVPETFVIDADGRIRHHHIGPIHANQLRDTILPIIEELREQ